jgi:hypothetical protein
LARTKDPPQWSQMQGLRRKARATEYNTSLKLQTVSDNTGLMPILEKKKESYNFVSLTLLNYIYYGLKVQIIYIDLVLRKFYLKHFGAQLFNRGTKMLH